MNAISFTSCLSKGFAISEHGELTRIRSKSMTNLCMVPWYANCDRGTQESELIYSDTCNTEISIFLYDKVNGVLRHVCTDKKVCMKDWGGDEDLVLSDRCDDIPVWHGSNNRFTRTSCKFYITDFILWYSESASDFSSVCSDFLNI